jgi:hypothetical protein
MSVKDRMATDLVCGMKVDIVVGLPGLEPGTSSLSGRKPYDRGVPTRPRIPLRQADFSVQRHAWSSVSIADYRSGWSQCWCQALQFSAT